MLSPNMPFEMAVYITKKAGTVQWLTVRESTVFVVDVH